MYICMCDIINMIGKKLLKSFKKKSSLIFFCITLLYLFYTYVSLFLFIFNNALFYLFVNILLFYVCFHFVVRALTYPGSLFIYQNKVNIYNIFKWYIYEFIKVVCYLIHLNNHYIFITFIFVIQNIFVITDQL